MDKDAGVRRVESNGNSSYFVEPLPGNRRATTIEEETTMAWTTPTLVEICIGLEINGYLPAEF